MVGIIVMHAGALVDRAFSRSRLPVWLKPVAGGLVVGAMAVYTPQIMAAGHGAMALDLDLDMTATMIVTIILLKLLACIVSLGSGFRGGLFFASLFVGCLLGKLYAVVLIFPDWILALP